MRLLILLGAALAGVLLFLLATASGNTSVFASHYPLLLGLNAVLAALLAALVAWQMRTLWRKYRQRAFGSRLTVRILLLLALMAVVPGALVYTVSVQFLSKSIESWFDVKVDAALEGGINLGQSAIDRMQGELLAKARSISLELTDRPTGQLVLLLSRLRDQAGVQEAVVVNASGRVLAEASENVSRLVPDQLPTPQALRQARTGRAHIAVDAAAGKPLAIRVLVPVAGLALADESRFLQLRQTVPEQFAKSAEAVESAYRDYRELALARQGLKRIYIVTLTLALSMALLVAIALSVVLANRLSEPLANLAQATQAVARGDFSRQAPVTSRDELGVLIESFNSMTRQLDDARRVVEANRAALESAKARLENILANLSAGVLVFDRNLGLSI
jgi:nitrogen fixation/metabolism regulation signal transduction histidine kinase